MSETLASEQFAVTEMTLKVAEGHEHWW